MLPLGSRSSGFALLDLLDDRPELGRELLRDLGRLALGVEVDRRLVRIRERLGPAAVVEDLDPVGQVDVAARRTARSGRA